MPTATSSRAVSSGRSWSLSEGPLRQIVTVAGEPASHLDDRILLASTEPDLVLSRERRSRWRPRQLCQTHPRSPSLPPRIRLARLFSKHSTPRGSKIEKGEDVAGGRGKPVDLEAALLTAGFTKRQLRNMRHLNALLTELESRGIEKDFWDAHRKHLAASDLRTNRPPNAMCFASTALGGGIDPFGRLGRPRRGSFSGERSSATPSRYDLAD
jgi:hypothetical protein